MISLILLGLACETADTGDTGDTDDTAVDTGDSAVPSACDCTDPTNLNFSADTVGGFDDWSGNAVVWAIDESAGQVLVVALAYDLGVGTIERSPDCAEPDSLVGGWVAAVPPSGEGDVAAWPLLGAAITNAAGVRSLSHNMGALLLEGQLQTSTPTAVYVATGGGVTLSRGEGGDRLLGALSFGATATAVGGDATVVCDSAPRVAAMDLQFSSGGGE